MISEHESRPARLKLRCPKCRSNNLFFTEVSEATVTWEVLNGKFDLNTGIQDIGCIVGYTLQCSECNHWWQSRKSFMDVIVEEEQ